MLQLVCDARSNESRLNFCLLRVIILRKHEKIHDRLHLCVTVAENTDMYEARDVAVL